MEREAQKPARAISGRKPSSLIDFFRGQRRERRVWDEMSFEVSCFRFVVRTQWKKKKKKRKVDLLFSQPFCDAERKKK